MLYSLTINIASKRISINAGDGLVLIETPNIVALDDENKLACIGETADEIQERVPQEWAQVKDKIRFANIFSTDSFDPLLAASTIQYLAYLATHSSNPQPRWTKDLVALRINIEGYEKLGKDVWKLFEYYVQKNGPIRVKSLNIQTQTINLGMIRFAQWSAYIGGMIALMLVFPILLGLRNVLLAAGVPDLIPKDKEALYFAVFIGGMGSLLYLMNFIFLIIWKASIGRFLPDIISRDIIEQHKLGLSKPIMNLIWRKSFSTKAGG